MNDMAINRPQSGNHEVGAEQVDSNKDKSGDQTYKLTLASHRGKGLVMCENYLKLGDSDQAVEVLIKNEKNGQRFIVLEENKQIRCIEQNANLSPSIYTSRPVFSKH